MEIIKYALEALNNIFKLGYQYKKAEGIITEAVPDTGIQTDQFDIVDRDKHNRLMKVVDNLNKGFIPNVLNLAI